MLLLLTIAVADAVAALIVIFGFEVLCCCPNFIVLRGRGANAICFYQHTIEGLKVKTKTASEVT